MLIHWSMNISSMDELMNFLGHIAGLGGLIWICMVPAVCFIVGPHFHKMFKNKYDPYDVAFDFPKFGRAGRYSFMIVFGNGMKRSINRIVYGNFNFRQHARLIDKIISFIAWYAFIIGLIAAGLAMICGLIIKIMSLA
jgi:hypothetical protein